MTNNDFQSLLPCKESSLLQHKLFMHQQIELWDTPGDLRFTGLSPLYARHANLLIAVIDASSATMLQNTEDLLKRCLAMRHCDHQSLLLVVTKLDICFDSALLKEVTKQHCWEMRSRLHTKTVMIKPLWPPFEKNLIERRNFKLPREKL